MTTRIDVAEVIENQSRSTFQMMLMFWISISFVIEGYDNQVQGYTAPAIISAWHISSASFSPVFVFYQAGFMLGAVLVGNLGDIIGRRLTIVFGVMLFGVFTIAGAYTTDLTQLTVTRFLSAVSFGGVIPNTIVLAVEYAPTRRRGIRVGIMYVLYEVGAAAGGFLAAWLVPSFGWPSVYHLGGWSELALGIILFFVLPESARFMVVRQRNLDKLATIMQRLSSSLVISSDTTFVATTEKRERASVVELFRKRRALKTVALWIALIANTMVIIFSTSWMPTIFAASGMGYSFAVIATGLFQAGGAVGSAVCGWVLDKSRGIRTLAIIALIGVPIVIGVGNAVGLVPLLLLLVTSTGFCVLGVATGLWALSGLLYPTAIRSTGSGWAYGMARIGSILGPVLGGVLLALHLPPSEMFSIIALPVLVLGITLLILHSTYPHAATENT